MTNLIDTVRRMAESHGCDFRDCGGGHVQIRANGVCINFYPLSKRSTAYCNETGERQTNCTFYNAVAMAMRGKADSPPKPQGHKKPRKNGPDRADIEPKSTNPAGIRHLWDAQKGLPVDMGDFQFLANSDRLRYQAKMKADEAEALQAKADYMDEVL